MPRTCVCCGYTFFPSPKKERTCARCLAGGRAAEFEDERPTEPRIVLPLRLAG